MTKTYYFIALRESDGTMTPIAQLFMAQNEAMEFHDRMQRMYPDKEYSVLKAVGVRKGTTTEVESMGLYDADKLKAASDEITGMAERFGIEEDDVTYASWQIAKDVVAARLKRDVEDRR